MRFTRFNWYNNNIVWLILIVCILLMLHQLHFFSYIEGLTQLPATALTTLTTKIPHLKDTIPTNPAYKFEGCWSRGNSLTYPILKDAWFDVQNMAQCVRNAHSKNFNTAGYDGHHKCIAGNQDYSANTPTYCDNTYGKSAWLIYHKPT